MAVKNVMLLEICVVMFKLLVSRLVILDVVVVVCCVVVVVYDVSSKLSSSPFCGDFMVMSLYNGKIASFRIL